MEAAETKKHVGEASSVGDIVSSRSFLSFSPDQYVKLILPAMQRAGAGCAGVVDHDDRLIGMLTEREILRRIFAMLADPVIRQDNIGKNIDDMTVRDVMIRYPITLEEDMDIEDALALMTKLGFRFMPVVSSRDSRKLIGLLDERELAIHVQNRLAHVKKEAAEKEAMIFSLFHEPYGVGYCLHTI